MELSLVTAASRQFVTVAGPAGKTSLVPFSVQMHLANHGVTPETSPGDPRTEDKRFSQGSCFLMWTGQTAFEIRGLF